MVSAAVAAAVVVVAGPARASGDGSGTWERTATPALTRADVGLPAGASVTRLAARAIARTAPRLARDATFGGLRFAGELPHARGMRELRFTRALDGLRVLWSDYHVTIAHGEVRSIRAAVVPLRDAQLHGTVAISAARASALARRAVFGAGAAHGRGLVAYAGEPGAPRAARRAYVVEVAPRASDEEDPVGTCVVVDAQTGRILTRWRGEVARTTASFSPASSRLRAHGAAQTVLNQVVDGHDTAIAVTPDWRDTTTFGNPYRFGSDLAGGLGWVDHGLGLSSIAKTTYGWVVDVSHFFCLARSFCGRDSGLAGPIGHGDYNRNFFTVNWQPPGENIGARYIASEQRIYVSQDASRAPGIIAHEFGHQIDHVFRDDFVWTIEGQEVSEALADMFGFDYESGVQRVGVFHPTITEQATAPRSYGFRDTYAGYNCTVASQHYNGWILTHAYQRIVSLIGYSAAGNLLQYIPYALPAMRTFASMRSAFVVRAKSIFGTYSWQAGMVAQAFDEAGVTSSSTRSVKCPGKPL